MNQKIEISFIVFMVLIVIIGILFFAKINSQVNDERDSKGCLTSAGYSWNDNINACIKEGELDETQREAARIATNYVGFEEGISVTDVIKQDCYGCFEIKFSNADSEFKTVLLKNWKVSE